jgi:phage terminase large subunit
MTAASAPAALTWPPDYVAELIARQYRLRRLKADAWLRGGLSERYRDDPVTWIAHWAVTYDPRKAASDAPTVMPFVPFPRQVEMIAFLHAWLRNRIGNVDRRSCGRGFG